MNKFIPSILFFFFISESFVAVFSSVSTSVLVENSWNTKTSMCQARWGLGVVATDEKIYAIGGHTWNPYNPHFPGYLTDANEQYDPVTDTWVTKTTMLAPRYNFAIAAYQGKIYCIGGLTPDAWNMSVACGLNEVYDTVTDKWSSKALLPINSQNLQAHVVDGQIFVLSGRDLYMYDPIADSWNSKSSAPVNTSVGVRLVSVVMAGKIILVNVMDEVYLGNTQGITQKFMFYDPKTDVWSEGKSLPTLVTGGDCWATLGIYAPRRIYILGLTSNDVYDPISDTWLVAETMLTARRILVLELLMMFCM